MTFRHSETYCKIRGSQGYLTIDHRGRVLTCHSRDEDGYGNIIRIDLTRYRRETGDMDFQEIDILRVGYWYLTAEGLAYEEPVADVMTGAACNATAGDIAASAMLRHSLNAYAPIILGA